MPLDPFLQQSQESVQPAQAALSPGQKVFGGRFVLQRHLGQGGMGQVWLAQDTALDEPRALKFVLPALLSDASAHKRLRNEARLGTHLAHPRIVRVFDFAEESDGTRLAAVVMEYVKGRTLNELLAAQEIGFFEPEEIERWVQDVIEGLRYAHEEKQRFHLDLKPGNIIIETATGRAKLLDFGISRSAKDTITRLTGQVSSGTLPYMSPQQLDGESPCAADDVYGLGATLYELLTGTPPFFRGKLEDQIRNKVPESLMDRRRQNAKEGLNAGVGGEIHPTVSLQVASGLDKLPCRRVKLSMMNTWMASTSDQTDINESPRSSTAFFPQQNTAIPPPLPATPLEARFSFFKSSAKSSILFILISNVIACIPCFFRPDIAVNLFAHVFIITSGLILGFWTISRCNDWGGRWIYAKRAIYLTAVILFIAMLASGMLLIGLNSSGVEFSKNVALFPSLPIIGLSEGAAMASIVVWVFRGFSRLY